MENCTENPLIFRLYSSIKDHNFHETQRLLYHYGDVNSPVLKSHCFIGYTALHMACMAGNRAVVELLVNDYRANVDLEAKDGTRPIHVASLLGYLDIVTILSEANANVDAKFGRKIYSKWGKFGTWSDDFGEKMNLLSFAVVNNLTELAILLVKKTANLKVKSIFNKTLLMYAIEKDNYFVAVRIIRKLRDPEFINARDNEGIPAVHYLIHKNKYGDYRYDPEQCLLAIEKGSTLKQLMAAGADIDVLINDDPDSLLLNLAVYRGSFVMVDTLVPYHSGKENCKALYNMVLSSKNDPKYIRISPDMYQRYNPQHEIEKCRKECIKYILRNVVFRRTFGVYFPEQQKKLVDEILAVNPSLQSLYNDIQVHDSNGFKMQTIGYGNNSITMFDFAVKVFNSRDLKILIRNKNLMDAFSQKIFMGQPFIHLNVMCKIRVKQAVERVDLLERLNKVINLRDAIPLPYECTLQIVEFLSNEDLEKFINSFGNF